MKLCRCNRPAMREGFEDGSLCCEDCCEHDDCLARAGCVYCGEEDSETANGCDLCFECGVSHSRRTSIVGADVEFRRMVACVRRAQ